jgi:hypothetical protein
MDNLLMKYFINFLLILTCFSATSQNLEQIAEEILQEGLELYRSELASWISTDSIPRPERHKIFGYFTYRDDDRDRLISLYVDSTFQKAEFKFIFKEVGDLEIELEFQQYEVPLTEKEKRILTVRLKAQGLTSMWYQTFGYSQIVNPNIIVHKIEPLELYVIAGAKQSGLLPLGGDLRLTFKSDGELDQMDAIHHNLLPFSTETPEEAEYMAHEHRGEKLAKEYMTSTDICTLLLYRNYLNEEKHLSVHKKHISEFYFNEPRLVIRPNLEKMKLK